MSIGKRLVPALATGFMTIVLTACGGSSSGSAGGTPVETPIAPTITSQPADQTAITGQTATFSVKATGTSLSYQWKKNGSNITGATSSSYTTPAISSDYSGTKYSVSVSNSLTDV
ncbi:MAG: immunoglobulin domain-containing protein [Rhodoferax sp.]|nr:immunoglobulin domain-containing protein [Rhodoferax sp.]